MTQYGIYKPQSWMHRDFFFFSLSKQPLINKSLDLPMGSYVKEVLAANAMVTIVITGKKQNKQTKKTILWPKKSDSRPTSILGWRPRCRFMCMHRNDLLSAPFSILCHYVEFRLLQGVEKSCLSPWYVTSLRGSWTCTKLWQTPAVPKAAGCPSAILSSH